MKAKQTAWKLKGGSGCPCLAAVAYGWRQGNLLHFGFEQSPAELNQNGRALLVNAIVYIRVARPGPGRSVKPPTRFFVKQMGGARAKTTN